MKLGVRIVGWAGSRELDRDRLRILIEALRDMRCLAEVPDIIEIESLLLIDENDRTVLRGEEASREISNIFKLLAFSGERFPDVVSMLRLESQESMLVKYFSYLDIYIVSRDGRTDIEACAEKAVRHVRRWVKTRARSRVRVIYCLYSRKFRHELEKEITTVN